MLEHVFRNLVLQLATPYAHFRGRCRPTRWFDHRRAHQSLYHDNRTPYRYRMLGNLQGNRRHHRHRDQ